MSPVYKALGSWVRMCTYTWSPWLHIRSDKHTVVDSVHICFDKDHLPPAVVEKIRKELGGDADDRLVFDRDRYRSWETECNIEFTYEQLDLRIVDGLAYFEDSLGRQSRWTFLIDKDADDCGPMYTTATAGAEAIPWLLCCA